MAIAKNGGGGPTLREMRDAPPGTYPEAESQLLEGMAAVIEEGRAMMKEGTDRNRRLVADYDPADPTDSTFLMAVLARKLDVSYEELWEHPAVEVNAMIEAVAAVDGSITRRGDVGSNGERTPTPTVADVATECSRAAATLIMTDVMSGGGTNGGVTKDAALAEAQQKWGEGMFERRRDAMGVLDRHRDRLSIELERAGLDPAPLWETVGLVWSTGHEDSAKLRDIGRRTAALIERWRAMRAVGGREVEESPPPPADATFDPTPADRDIMQALAESPTTLTLAEIEAASGHRLSVVTGRMKVMEGVGLAHRPHGERKGRALTPAGRALLATKQPLSTR